MYPIYLLTYVLLFLPSLSLSDSLKSYSTYVPRVSHPPLPHLFVTAEEAWR